MPCGLVYRRARRRRRNGLPSSAGRLREWAALPREGLTAGKKVRVIPPEIQKQIFELLPRGQRKMKRITLTAAQRHSEDKRKINLHSVSSRRAAVSP
jgi:hypothetical protein